MSVRKYLNQIIERVPALKKGKDLGYIQDTINLEESIKPENREDTVRLYYFAKTLKQTFEDILMAFSEPIGRGFWLTAEYGVGKSHFLATLACLLSDNADSVWNCVHDGDVRNFQFQFKKRRLFPVIAGLRGKTAIAQDKPISLLDQLEKEIDESVDQLGLQDKINITPVAETLALFDKFDLSLQGAINNFIQQQSGIKPSDLRKNEPSRFADFIRRYFKKSNIPLDIKYNINDRLRYLYDQIVKSDSGYNGLLFVIDEYESWLSQRPITSQGGMFDSNVLQALTEILPKQYNYEIYTVIASQTDIPAQLQGRFRSLPLLAGAGAERDYHVICAHRVRKYKPNMEAEAKLYYHDFYDEFACYKSETEISFLETFPFHPLSYEIVRRFTSSVQDMPGVRLGLNIFYDVIKSDKALNTDRPITVSEVHKNSPNFLHSLASPRFSNIEKRYLDSLGLLPKVFSDEEDVVLSEAILTVLYLQYVISGDQTIPMSAAELADATLTKTGAITGEQRITTLLGEMTSLISQLEFDASHPDRGARFIPKQTGPTPQQILEGLKKEFLSQVTELYKLWERLLFAPLTQTQGQKAQFNNLSFDKPWNDEVIVNQITYKGEILVASSWRPDLGAIIQDPYLHFRLIYLLHANSNVMPDLRDPRIVVVETSALNDKLKELCAIYLGAEKMMKDFDPQSQKGPDAAEVRSFAEKRFGDSLTKIIQGQLEPFQKGRAITRDQINLDVLSAFSKPTSDQRHMALLRPTLENAYPEFGRFFSIEKIEKPIVQADAKNLLSGLIQEDSSKAVKSTLELKAVGLGLAQPEDPKRLSPQNSQFFKLLDERLNKSSAIPLWPLIREMAACPFGIPPYLLTSLLLVYTRYRNVPSPVEIQLNPQHNITNQSGQRLTINRITRANVVDLRWQSDMEKHFDSLIAVSGPDWNSIQPYAKLINPDAKVTINPQEIDVQIDTFFRHLKSQLPLISSAIENIEALVKGINDSLLESDKQLLTRFKEIYSAEDLDEFAAKTKFVGTDYPKFKESFDRLLALRDLSAKTHQILDLYRIVHDVDTGENEELRTTKELLLVRYKLSSMIGNPTYVASVLIETEKFIKKFQNAQEVHTQRTKEVLCKLKEILTGCNELLTGLGKLNQLEMLGPPQGHDLAGQLERLMQSIGKEISGESKRHQELSYVPPEQETKQIQQNVKQAFENRIGILKSQLEKAIQEKGKDDDIKTLLDLIQVNKLPDLAKNLTPAMVETIKKILEKARTQVVRSRALERLADEFPALGQEDLDKFIAELKKLLERDFAEKGKDGKKIILTFK